MCGSPAWFLCRTWRKNHKRTFNRHHSRVATLTDTAVPTAPTADPTATNADLLSDLLSNAASPEHTIQASRSTDQGEPSDVLTLHEAQQAARKRPRQNKAA